MYFVIANSDDMERQSGNILIHKIKRECANVIPVTNRRKKYERALIQHVKDACTTVHMMTKESIVFLISVLYSLTKKESIRIPWREQK